MSSQDRKRKAPIKDIWVLVQHRDFGIEEVTFGLIAEAQRIIADRNEAGGVTAVAIGYDLEEELHKLGPYGAKRVIYLQSEAFANFQGELFAKALWRLVNKSEPDIFLMAQSAETEDLAPRLAALQETALVTRAMDLKIDADGRIHVMRPIANGYLFQEVRLHCPRPPIISFLPSVLTPAEPSRHDRVKIQLEPLRPLPDDLQTHLIEVIEADPETLDLEDAEIIVAGGRGVGKGQLFDIIHLLAKTLDACVGGTRPVIDWQTLPFESQIGQTGKTVAPRLIINCGISGANEYTAGMEKSQLVIAINKDPRARIFRFADVGVVADVHQILPLLVEQIEELKVSN